MYRILPWLIVLVLAACQQESADPAGSPPATTQLPAGFLDEPPPPPTSATTLLAGGTLITTQAVADSVLMIRDGNLLAWGRRGDVDVPNDSVGFDLRGKWIVGGVIEDGSVRMDPALLQRDRPARLLILNVDPERVEPLPSNVVGWAIDGELRLPESG